MGKVISTRNVGLAPVNVSAPDGEMEIVYACETRSGFTFLQRLHGLSTAKKFVLASFLYLCGHFTWVAAVLADKYLG